PVVPPDGSFIFGLVSNIPSRTLRHSYLRTALFRLLDRVQFLRVFRCGGMTTTGCVWRRCAAERWTRSRTPYLRGHLQSFRGSMASRTGHEKVFHRISTHLQTDSSLVASASVSL